MRVLDICPSKPGGPYERSVRALAKRYRNVATDIDEALDELKDAPAPAPPNVVGIPGVGRVMLKVRVASRDLKRGKSGGFRVILDHVEDDTWRRVLAYAKTDTSDVDRSELVRAAVEEEAEEAEPSDGRPRD